MVDTRNYRAVFCGIQALEEKLPGRTVQQFDVEEGEIYFTDGSVLKMCWQFENEITYELYEKPIEESDRNG